MARVYILMNVLIPDYSRSGAFGELERFSLSAPGERRRNYPLASFLNSGLRLSVVYTSAGYAHIMLQAPNRRVAYDGAAAIQGTLALLSGDEPRPYPDGYSLRELNHVPRSAWNREKLLEELRGADPLLPHNAIDEFDNGYVLDPHRLRGLLTYLPQVLDDRRISGALRELMYSRTLFYGYMVESFYSSHYVHERRALRKTDLEKRYFEYREKYDLAFLSAFKALERFLGVGQLKKPDIARRIDALPYPEIRASSTYRRYFEIFSGARRRETYAKMFEHFLDIRNVAAAHANPSPPPSHIVSEDSIFEIQHFVEELCHAALQEMPLLGVPQEAIVD